MLKRLLLGVLLLLPLPTLAAPPHGAAAAVGNDAMTQLLATMAPNTWAAVTTQGGQASSDYEQVCFFNGPTDPNYPGTGAPDYNATVAADNGSSCLDNTGPYQGVAYDSNANRFLIGAGGGHSTGFENSIMEFSFSTLKWKRLTTPDDTTSLFNGSPQYGTFSAVGGIDFSTFPGTMTITSISAGKILVNGLVTWTAWSNATNVPNTPTYVASQISGTTGGVGTYSIWWTQANISGGQGIGNTPGLCSTSPGSCNVPPGTGLYGVYSSNQTQGAQTWNGLLLNNSCQTNITGINGVHDYGNIAWISGWPDTQGSLLYGGFRAPWAFFSLDTVNEASPLPTPVNWQPPSYPTDASGLPTVSDCSKKSGWHLAAGPFGATSWEWSNWVVCVPFCGQGSWVGQVPNTTKIFQVSAGITGGFVTELLYDLSKDANVTSTSIPPPYLSQDNGSRPPGPPGPSPTNPFTVLNGTGHNYGPGCGPWGGTRSTSLWLIGDGSQSGSCSDGDFFGIRSFDMNTGNTTDYTENPSNSDNWIFTSYLPYGTYYPPGDVFVMLGTQGHSGTRNTTAYGGISPGNIFDIVSPTPNGSGQISVSQHIAGGISMPSDLNCGGHSAGSYGHKLQYDAAHNAFVLLTCIGPSAPPATVYVFKPGLVFP